MGSLPPECERSASSPMAYCGGKLLTVGVDSFGPFQSTSSEADLYLVCLAPASFPSSVSSVRSSQEQGTGFTQGQQACS